MTGNLISAALPALSLPASNTPTSFAKTNEMDRRNTEGSSLTSTSRSALPAPYSIQTHAPSTAVTFHFYSDLSAASNRIIPSATLEHGGALLAAQDGSHCSASSKSDTTNQLTQTTSATFSASSSSSAATLAVPTVLIPIAAAPPPSSIPTVEGGSTPSVSPLPTIISASLMGIIIFLLLIIIWDLCRRRWQNPRHRRETSLPEVSTRTNSAMRLYRQSTIDGARGWYSPQNPFHAFLRIISWPFRTAPMSSPTAAMEGRIVHVEEGHMQQISWPRDDFLQPIQAQARMETEYNMAYQWSSSGRSADHVSQSAGDHLSFSPASQMDPIHTAPLTITNPDPEDSPATQH